jgi:hypothetical protein
MKSFEKNKFQKLMNAVRDIEMSAEDIVHFLIIGGCQKEAILKESEFILRKIQEIYSIKADS